jgi:hypothetical protein
MKRFSEKIINLEIINKYFNHKICGEFHEARFYVVIASSPMKVVIGLFLGDSDQPANLFA